MKVWQKYSRVGPYGLCAFCLVALAITLRLLLIQDWPLTNSDEGTMGLMALHIAYQGNFPVFFYGQGYLGSLEAMLAAPLFRLLGPSDFSLRLGLVALYALFMLNMYLLTSILYTKRLALFTLLLLCFGSGEMLFLQLLAAGGYPDMYFLGSCLLLYALILARSEVKAPTESVSRAHMLAYAGWGILAGLALWDDPLLIPYIFMAGWLIWRFCRHELRKRVLSWIAAGFILALLPVVIYNLTEPLTMSTFTFIFAGFWVRGPGLQAASPLLRVAGTVFVALPHATGGDIFCASAWPPLVAQTPHAVLCTALSGLWGWGYIALLLVSASLAYASYRVCGRASKLSPWTAEQRHQALQCSGQLMLVGSVLLLLVIYTLSSPSGLEPRLSARYLSTTTIALPAVLWPIWRAGRRSKRKLLASSLTLLRTLLPGALLFFYVAGWIIALSSIPSAQTAERQEKELISTLLHRGITHIYTDYWTCDRIAFESTERIICNVVDEHLQPGQNRYTPYSPIIEADPRASWVLPIGSPQALAFDQNEQKSGQIDASFTDDGYVIYSPVT